LPTLVSGQALQDNQSSSENKRFTVNLADAGHSREVISIVAAANHWRTDIVQNRKAQVYVVISEEDISRRLACLRPGQRMSRIPGMRELCEKVALAKLFRGRRGADETSFAFFPRTYILPEDLDLALAQPGPLIFKPNAGAGGDGITVLTSGAELQSKLRTMSSARYWLRPQESVENCAVVQEYIHDPLLLQGFKWDIRVYAVVLSLKPLRVFLCKEGLARFCTEAYVPPTLKTAHKVASHLTNYSIGKYAVDYDHHDDPCDGTRGSKRTLSSTMAFLRALGHDVEDFDAQIHHIVAATTEAIAGEFSRCEDKVQHDCFHILGLDIMFDSSGQAWLLEVNTSPSLSIDSVFPAEGPHAQEPVEHPQDHPYAPLLNFAKECVRSKKTKICKCCSHHRPHLHGLCAVDLLAKTACVQGALQIVCRDMQHALGRPLSCAELAAGTGLLVVHDAGQA